MENRYLIVRKPFPAGEETLRHGEVVDTKDWRNTRSLLRAGYLKRPSGRRELEKVQDFIDGETKNTAYKGGN